MRKHIATLYWVRPEIVIEVRWYPAYKGVTSNEKVDKCVKIWIEKLDTCRVEWLNFSAQIEV